MYYDYLNVFEGELLVGWGWFENKLDDFVGVEILVDEFMIWGKFFESYDGKSVFVYDRYCYFLV